MGGENTMIGLFLLVSMAACNNSEDFPYGENLELKVKVNILNYTDQTIEPGTKVYIGAFDNNIFTPVDQIVINQYIPSKDEKLGYSQTCYPNSLENWDIDLKKVKDISVNGAILVELADGESEILVQEFTIEDTEIGIPIEITRNVSHEFGYYYELNVDISLEKIKLRKNSPIVIQ